MIPTITSFTNKILKEYPNASQIQLYVCDPTHESKYDNWLATIASIKVSQNNEVIKLTPQHYFDIMRTHRSYINLGKNNKTRQISNDNHYRLIIDTKLNTFTTNQGKTISYYHNEATPITSINLKAKILEAALNFDVGLFEAYRRQ